MHSDDISSVKNGKSDPELIQLRRDIHQHPEVSGKEKKTAERIKKELEKYHPDELLTGIGGYGLVARFGCSAGTPKKKILFRAELDAIAVQEETGLGYQSQNKNVMHGCGHDGHMTMLLGLAKSLNEKRPEEVDVYLIFQPAEETGEGAASMQKNAKFRKLNIDHAFALHNLPGFPAASVICKKDTFASGSVGIDIQCKGRSSHAAYPEKGLNPSAAVASLIQKIDTEMEAFRAGNESNKLVCTYIQMGERAFGISPGKASIGFTIRSASDQNLDVGVQIIHEIIKEVKKTFSGEITVQEVEPFRATVNSEEGAAIVEKVSNRLGVSWQTIKEPFPWSEDFGEFRAQFPITIFGLGVGEETAPLHSEMYDFNDDVLHTGIAMFRGIVDYYSTL